MSANGAGSGPTGRANAGAMADGGGTQAMRRAWLEADWPAPPGVHALATLRHGAGASMVPFDRFNLGNARGEAGDDPIVVAANRAEFTLRAGLPSAPTGCARCTAPGCCGSETCCPSATPPPSAGAWPPSPRPPPR